MLSLCCLMWVFMCELGQGGESCVVCLVSGVWCIVLQRALDDPMAARQTPEIRGTLLSESPHCTGLGRAVCWADWSEDEVR